MEALEEQFILGGGASLWQTSSVFHIPLGSNKVKALVRETSCFR